MPSYNERLTANNQKIDDITTLANELPDADEINEKIDAQDTIIENLKSALDEKAGKGGAKLNVFTQLEEPTTKKGIWLQTDKQMEHFVSDDNIFIGGTWALASDTAAIPYQFINGPVVSVGTDIYVLGGGYGSSNNYKYNTISNTYTKMTDIPYSFFDSAAVAIGTDIYLLGSGDYSSYGRYNYKYNTLTDTYTKMTNIPYDFYGGSATVVGTDIYIFGSSGSGNYRKNYKYNTLTDTWTQMTSIPYEFCHASAVTIGTVIYLFGSRTGAKDNYKYNTLTDTWTQMTSIPYAFNKGGAVAIGTNIYLLGGTSINNKRNNYKYNTLTDTWTQMTSIPYDFYNGSATVVGTDIYLLGGEGSKTTNRKFYAENKSYTTDNSVIVAQGKTYSVGYNVELLSTELAEEDFQPLYGFADAWFYTIQDGLITNIPTYYGDGTQWINIKNPIVEEVEE